MNYQRFYIDRFREKISLLFKVRFFFSLIICSQFNLNAQIDYLMTLCNGEKINQHLYEFDVTINSSGDDFELTSYQAVLSFDTTIINEGSITFSYIENTSDLNNFPSAGIGINNSDGRKKLTFASLPGSDIVSVETLKVGRFRIGTSEPYHNDPQINWNFQGKITTIITGSEFSDITIPAFHKNNLSVLSQFSVAGVTASETSDLNTAPEKTIDGLGYYDNEPNSRWAAHPMPQWISYDLGVIKEVSLVKISFFNFHLDRIYEYSVSISNDNVNWTEVVSNAFSLNEEWTSAPFSAVPARYIRIDILSSTNNPNNWANIWETEIYGKDLSTSSEPEIEVNEFQLLQNYPNPFNPVTKITFNLKQDAVAKLTVYNVLGEKISEPVSGYLHAGIHEIDFNGDNLASGIYIYKLDVENKFTELKKMVLIK